MFMVFEKQHLNIYKTPSLQSQSSNNMQKHKSSSSFTPFIDPRLLQVSPSTGSALNNVGKVTLSA